MRRERVPVEARQTGLSLEAPGLSSPEPTLTWLLVSGSGLRTPVTPTTPRPGDGHGDPWAFPSDSPLPLSLCSAVVTPAVLSLEVTVSRFSRICVH